MQYISMAQPVRRTDESDQIIVLVRLLFVSFHGCFDAYSFEIQMDTNYSKTMNSNRNKYM